MAEIVRTKQDSTNNNVINLEDKIKVEENLDIEKIQNSDRITDVLLKEEHDEIQQMIKEIKEENDIDEKDIKEYDDKIDERVSKISDAAFETVVDNIIEQSDVAPDQRALFKQGLINKLKRQQAIMDEFDENKSEFEKAISEIQQQMDDLFCNMKYNELLEKIQGMIDIATTHKQTSAQLYYQNLYKEIDSIIHLTSMKANVKKIKNPSKTIATCDERYNDEYKKFFNNLGQSLEYKFVDPSKLKDSLEMYLPDDKKEYAKYFMFSLFRYINAKGVKDGVDKNAVFLEGIFRIIYALNTDKIEDSEKEDFVNSIYEYVDMLKA